MLLFGITIWGGVGIAVGVIFGVILLVCLDPLVFLSPNVHVEGLAKLKGRCESSLA